MGDIRQPTFEMIGDGKSSNKLHILVTNAGKI